MLTDNERMLMRLCRAAVRREEICDAREPSDWEALFQLARANNVAALAARASLLSFPCVRGEVSERLKAAVNEARYIEAVQHFTVSELLARFESASVKYCMLKGWNLKNLYPEPMLRYACDVDILIEPNSWKKAVSEAENAGFKLNHDIDLHLVMEKGDVVIELHRFPLSSRSKNDSYFRDIWTRLLRVGSTSEYRLPPIDEKMLFYLHMDKHIMCYSFELRFLCDIAVRRMHDKKADNSSELRYLFRRSGVYYMQKQLSEIADSWISGSELTKRQEEILSFLFANINENQRLTVYRKSLQSLKCLFSPRSFIGSMNPPQEIIQTFSEYGGMTEKESFLAYKHSYFLKIKGAYLAYMESRKGVTRAEKKRNKRGLRLLYGR